MLSADEVSGGTSKVRNMTCARNDDYSGRQHTKKMQLVRSSHARESFARVMRARCGVLFPLSCRLLRIAILTMPMMMMRGYS